MEFINILNGTGKNLNNLYYNNKYYNYYYNFNSSYSPDLLKAYIESEHPIYKGNAMHDCTEFLVNFLSLLNKEMPKNINLISDIFTVKIKVSTIFEKKQNDFCLLNYYNSQKLPTNFKHLSNISCDEEDEDEGYFLDLPIESSDGHKLDIISECLDEFCKPIKFSGDVNGNEYNEIVHLSDSLIINLKRIVKGKQITHCVEYPDILDLSRYVKNNYTKLNYKLRGLIIHEGNEMYGHKIAICYNRNDGKWYFYDDDKRYECKNYLDQKNAFLLFYEKI